VADGTVAVAADNLPEQTPGTFPTNISPAEADGNSVVLDIGNGFYANYAHFQPGSVKVQVGDTVKRGDVLGLVGNSGNSVAPHLHFHVMNGPSQLASEGLPYLIDSFTVTGQVDSTAAFDKAEAEGTPIGTVAGVTSTTHEDQMVLDQNIVTYQAAG
jgi:murein DD-endopeptidase MepM/ murein hydrolase activator NlpD